MTTSRRQFLAGSIVALAAASFLPRGAVAQKTSTRIILLGTKGGPTVGTSGRSNTSTLLLINNEAYVVDCGYGVTRQLLSAKIALDRIRYIFITHHHSDHDLEYGPLMYNAWVAGNRPINIDAYGPTGLKQMTRDFFHYEKIDIETRIKDEGPSDLRKRVRVHDFHREGLVLRNDSVTVTSCKVNHPLIGEAYAYRFDAKDRSVVISGDTAYFPKLAEFAKGADVLIHEALYLPAVDAIAKASPDPDRLRKHLLASHTSTEDVGKIAAQAGVKTLVLSHLVPGVASTVITDEMWTEGVQKNFSGKVIVGKDLLEI
ncbi:MAG TPA: MBL fold metallo-hydrolase [Pyrinomonadaceae bacterium]